MTAPASIARLLPEINRGFHGPKTIPWLESGETLPNGALWFRGTDAQTQRVLASKQSTIPGYAKPGSVPGGKRRASSKMNPHWGPTLNEFLAEEKIDGRHNKEQSK